RVEVTVTGARTGTSGEGLAACAAIGEAVKQTGVKANRTYRTVSPGWESSVDCGLAKPAASGAAGYLAGLLRAHKRNAPTDYASKLEAQAAGSSPGWVATIRTGCTLPE